MSNTSTNTLTAAYAAAYEVYAAASAVYRAALGAADIAHGTVEVDGTVEVHVELPPGVDIVAADTRTAAAIHRVETATTDGSGH